LVSQVEMNDGPVRRLDRPALLNFVYEGLGQPVAWSELHAAQYRRGLWLAQVVVLEIAVAVFVEQPAALGARRLGDQDASERKSGWVILDELHVLERRACTVGQRHPITCADGGVGRIREDLAGSSVAQDDRLRGDDFDTPGHQLDRYDSVNASVIDEKPRDEPFVVPRDVCVFQ
jgi:hypothetical protein